MTRTLLAATDFSAPARHALERAALLAQAHPDARLMLAHVVSATALDRLRRLLPGEAGKMEAGLLAQAEQDLSEVASALASRYAGRIETEIALGSALSVLADLTETHDADLLVMGARGAHFVREMLLGSTTERVLRKLRRPLLAVKQRAQTPYRRILAPVDFSTHAAAAIRVAHAWIPDAEIVLLHAFEVELESTFRLAGLAEERIHEYRIQAREAAVAEMEIFAATLGVPAEQLSRQVVHGAPTLRIIEHEQTMDADLIVMGKHGLSVMEELLLGSVTKHVLSHSTSDVLVTGQPS
ncbi:MAG TPA: universal stress protein [Thiobacillaceae bacterium]|mgnify:CR=1 FL=1|nr:universal stress protein [Thiobacillaceae bacterium]